MTTIVSTKPHPSKEGQGFVRFDDDTEAWTPELDKVLSLVGKVVPADWTLKDGPYGKQMLPPKEGSKAAFRNTKEGFLAEAEGRLRWQQVEEERRDRRTALMQAVDAYGTETATQILARADDFYVWLREASGGSSSGESITPPASSSQRQQGTPPEETSGEGAGEAGTATEGYGEGPDVAVPSTTELATADDLAAAAKHGLTPTKAKALAKGLGFEWPPTREQLVAVIERYLEVKK